MVVETPSIQQVYTTGVTARPLAHSFSAPGWYPATFFTPNVVEVAGGNLEHLVITAGQYNPTLTTGQQRVFTGMSSDLYYHPTANDRVAPLACLSSSTPAAGTTTVAVSADDPSGVEAVVVAFTDGTGTWDSINLAQNSGNWSGSFASAAGTEFFVQAVDGAGNVAVNDNEGRYFRPGDAENCDSFIYLPLIVK